MQELARLARARLAGGCRPLLGGGRSARLLALDSGGARAGRRPRAPGPGPRARSADPETARLRALRRRRALPGGGRAQAQPLLIVLDDLHAADAASLVLLRFVGEALAEAPILLVGSYREREARRTSSPSCSPSSRGSDPPAAAGPRASADVEAYVAGVTGRGAVAAGGRAAARAHGRQSVLPRRGGAAGGPAGARGRWTRRRDPVRPSPRRCALLRRRLADLPDEADRRAAPGGRRWAVSSTCESSSRRPSWASRGCSTCSPRRPTPG